MPKIIKPKYEEVAFYFLAIENGRWKYTVKECCERLNVCNHTLKDITKSFGMPQRGSGQSIVPSCKDCDYLIVDCICSGKGIAHG